MRVVLDIPSSPSLERHEAAMRIANLPRVGDQIQLAHGIVEVVNVRHRPLWSDNDEGMLRDFGPGYTYDELEPLVVTQWVRRPGSRG